MLRRSNRKSSRMNHKGREGVRRLWILPIAGMLMLCGCSNHVPDVPPFGPQLSGNWQFTVANPPDQSFVGGVQGGFLVQSNNSLTGSLAFSISGSSASVCNSGSAGITGTISGQNITFTAVAGTQTFTFTGSVSTDNSTMVGSYSSTAGTANGAACGTAQTGLPWSAKFVPPLVGAIQGSFHSTGGNSGLMNQQFPVTGLITQAANSGESSAVVTGTLTFDVDPVSLLSVYPCIDTVTVNGRISGSTVTLQMIGSDGSNVGQIGGILPTQPVTFDRFHGGNVLHDMAGMGYAFNTQTCPGTSLMQAGDFGNICLGVATSSACSQPISLSPGALIFPPQSPGATSALPVYVQNNTQSTLSGITVTLANTSTTGSSFAIVGATCDVPGDSVAVPTPLPQPEQPFDLLAGQTCTFPVSFTSSAGAAGSGILSVTSPASVDTNKVFAVPVSATASAAANLSAKDIVEVACVQGRCSLLHDAGRQRALVGRNKRAIASKVVLW
jgi:hypothetical protein